MPSSTALNPAFNDFLFATVCEDHNEAPLSVVSALARLDLDPWIEAAELSRLPADRAALRLTSLLTGVANLPASAPDRATVAARLVALLPVTGEAAMPASVPASGVPAAAYVGLARAMCLFFLASMAVSVVLADLAPRAGASAHAPRPTPSAAARP
jgi:hypothetical protein